MPHSSMNIQDVARLLGIDSRRVEKMAQRGQIPCQKVGGQLRFNRAEITEWLQQQMGTMEQTHLASMDAGITAQRRIKPEVALVGPLLRPEAVATSLPARTKNSVLRELVALAQHTGLVYDEGVLLDALIKREELCSTAMEGGVAIPHPRRPLPNAIADSILVIAHTAQGIGFGAPDGGLTDLFFLTCSLDDRHHLHVLARLCRMLNLGKLAPALRLATSAEQIVQMMLQQEEQVLAQSS